MTRVPVEEQRIDTRPGADLPIAGRRLAEARRLRSFLWAVFLGFLALSIVGALGLLLFSLGGFGDGAGGAGFFFGLGLVAFATLAVPVALIAAAVFVVRRAARALLRPGDPTDLDLARDRGAASAPRSQALAREMQSDRAFLAALGRLESQRRLVVEKVVRRRWLFLSIAAVPALTAIAWLNFGTATVKRGSPLLGSIVIIVVAAAFALMFAERAREATDYTAEFRRTIAPALLGRFGFSATGPGVELDAATLAAAADLVPTLDPGSCRIGGPMSGVHNGRPMSIVEYQLFRRDKDGRIEPEFFTVAGVIVATSAQRPLNGRVIVGGPVSQCEWGPVPVGLQPATLEDPSFHSIYRIWVSDQGLAQAVLTPRVKNAMLATTENSAFLPPSLSIHGDSITIFAPFALASTKFLEADANEASAFGQVALQLETLGQLFVIAGALIDGLGSGPGPET